MPPRDKRHGNYRQTTGFYDNRYHLEQMGHTVEMFLRIYSEYIEAYADQQIFDTPLERKLP